jgi:hypothetical protein
MVFAIVECWPRPWDQQLPLPVPPFYQQLASKPGSGAVLDLPIPMQRDYGSAYQWYQLTHGRPIAWGYLSRGFLRPPVAPIEAIVEGRVSNAAEIRRELGELGYGYVVWHKYATTLFMDRSSRRAAAPIGAPAGALTNPFIRTAFEGEHPVLDDELTTVYRIPYASASPAGR